MYGRVYAKIIEAPPHGWGIFRHWFPSHVVHGSPGVPAQATSQPVRPSTVRIQDTPTGLPDTATGGSKLQDTRNQTWSSLGANESNELHKQRTQELARILATHWTIGAPFRGFQPSEQPHLRLRN